jgi:phosphoribosylaminoimidazole-succinocarboxamide synthase
MAKLLYEGKAKKVFATDAKDTYLVQYKDDATAFNGEKKGTIAGKGVINNQMSNYLFARLEEQGVPTHFLEQVSERETLVRAVKIIPLEVVVRNVVAGSLSKRLGIPEGEPLPFPLVEFYYKDDALGDPLVTLDHIAVLNVAAPDDVAELKRMALQVNAVLEPFFRKRDVLLVDFKLEFGRDSAQKIRLADEISPDTCRFWDIKSGERLDKDRFRRDLGDVEQAYQEMWQRVGKETMVE